MFDPVHLGRDEYGEQVHVNLAERNILLGGEPGAGKSSGLNLIVAHGALSCECKLILVDGKLTELGMWRACADQFIGPLKLDGTAASPDYLGRRRRVLYNILKYAVREHRLTENPLDTTEWEPPESSIEEISPRVVASPEQVRQLLAAVSYVGARRGGRLVAFFACLYFAMLRPSEAVALRADDCHLPESGWGRLDLNQTAPSVGKQWTDTGAGHERRGLKNQPRRAVRVVPIPPELVAILRQHITRYGLAPDGRLFRSEQGGVLYPSSYRYVWQQARPLALTPSQVASPLALRPYDMRHGGVSLRLNAGVPATQVAEWAGHSVEVLLTIYAKCIHGRDQVWFTYIDRALTPDEHV